MLLLIKIDQGSGLSLFTGVRGKSKRSSGKFAVASLPLLTHTRGSSPSIQDNQPTQTPHIGPYVARKRGKRRRLDTSLLPENSLDEPRPCAVGTYWCEE